VLALALILLALGAVLIHAALAGSSLADLLKGSANLNASAAPGGAPGKVTA